MSGKAVADCRSCLSCFSTGWRGCGPEPCTKVLRQVRDAGNLLMRAGLAIPAVDVDDIQVHYADVVQLVQHLRWALLRTGYVGDSGSEEVFLGGLTAADVQLVAACSTVAGRLIQSPPELATRAHACARWAPYHARGTCTPCQCRSMGESSGLTKRRQQLPRDVALAAAGAYAGLFAEEDGSIPGGWLGGGMYLGGAARSSLPACLAWPADRPHGKPSQARPCIPLLRCGIHTCLPAGPCCLQPHTRSST
jgi:hypothetical protein